MIRTLSLFLLASPKSIFCLLFLLTISGCKEDDKAPKRAVEFTTLESSVSEGNSVVIELTLDDPTTTTEYITFAISSSDAAFGVDYGIAALYENDGEFTIKLPASTKTASFTIFALEDFEEESIESLFISIAELSEGLIGQDDIHTVNIDNVTNHSADNRAISFDGIDDYIDLGNIYDNLALPVTISAWIWLDPTAPADRAMPIFDSQDGLPLYNGFNLLTSTRSIAGVQYGDGYGENHVMYRRAKAATFAPVAGRWVNFTAVIRGTTDMSIYFNGVDVGGEYQGESTSPMNSYSPEEVAKIGAFYQNGVHYKFKGKIDEVKVWNRALSVPDIQRTIFTKSPSSESGLIGYWNFDEPNGEAVLDGSSNNFDGVIKGNAIRIPSEVPVR